MSDPKYTTSHNWWIDPRLGRVDEWHAQEEGYEPGRPIGSSRESEEAAIADLQEKIAEREAFIK